MGRGGMDKVGRGGIDKVGREMDGMISGMGGMEI